MKEDIIAAIATPPGEGGIAIIRISGAGAIQLIDSIFQPRNPSKSLSRQSGYSITLGWILDNDGNQVDEVLAAVMRKPHSYTAEDTVEIHCHGGILAARRCLEEALNTGIRLAEPGEFTKRAFLNGRLDVSQAEAVIEIIRAKSDKSLRLAVKQLAGYNSTYIHDIEDKLIQVNAMIEASIDFPDEVGDPDESELSLLLTEALQEIYRMLRAGERGKIYREGIKVVICGKPNVGKSSLLNRLLGQDRAIVTDIPGTTRDVLEEYINIKGIPIRLMDTAGIHTAQNEVEQIGVQKARDMIREAALAIFIVDVASGITPADLDVFQSLDRQRAIVLVNKEDLEAKRITPQQMEEVFSGLPVIRCSMKENIGVELLEDTIENMVLAGNAEQDELELMLNMRQQKALENSAVQIEMVLSQLSPIPLDCLAVDVRGALESLHEITGRNCTEEIVDRIFHDFCIGK